MQPQVIPRYSPVVRAEGEPPIALDSGCLPLAVGSIADVATNLNLNLVMKNSGPVAATAQSPATT